MKKSVLITATIAAISLFCLFSASSFSFAGVGGVVWCVPMFPNLQIGDIILVGDITPVPRPIQLCERSFAENDPFVLAGVGVGWFSSAGNAEKTRVYFTRSISKKGIMRVRVSIHTGIGTSRHLQTEATVCGYPNEYLLLFKVATKAAMEKWLEKKYAEIRNDLRKMYSINRHHCDRLEEKGNGITLEIEGGYKLYVNKTPPRYSLHSPLGWYNTSDWRLVTAQIG